MSIELIKWALDMGFTCRVEQDDFHTFSIETPFYHTIFCILPDDSVVFESDADLGLVQEHFSSTSEFIAWMS